MANFDKAGQTLAVLEEALGDPTEWRDIPEVVKQAFRATHGLFKWQLEATSQLIGELDRRVDKDDLKKAFKFKANVVDVEESMEKISEALEQKVSLEDIEGLLGDFAMKKDLPITDPQLEARIEKLEQMALNLDVDDKELNAKHFATRAELTALENAIQECAHVEDVRTLAKEALTVESLEDILKTRIGPELSQQIEELQEQTRNNFLALEQQINERAEVQDLLAIKRDLDRLMKQGLLSVPQETSVLKNRLETVEKDANDLKSDLRDLSEVHKDLQTMLDKLAHEISGLVLASRLDDLERGIQSSLGPIEDKLKLLEHRDQRTQEVLEVLAQARLPSMAEDYGQSSGRAGLKPETILEQMEHIKDYINKKLRKTESALASRDEMRSLEHKFEEFETQTNQIFETLKEMVRDLAQKLKSNSKSLEEKIEFRLKNPIYQPKQEARSPSVVGQVGSEAKIPGVSDKMKSLDNLIARVAGLVDKKTAEDNLLQEINLKLQKLEDGLKEKADKIKISKLLDAKAGKMKFRQKSKMSTVHL